MADIQTITATTDIAVHRIPNTVDVVIPLVDDYRQHVPRGFVDLVRIVSEFLDRLYAP